MPCGPRQEVRRVIKLDVYTLHLTVLMSRKVMFKHEHCFDKDMTGTIGGVVLMKVVNRVKCA